MRTIYYIGLNGFYSGMSKQIEDHEGHSTKWTDIAPPSSVSEGKALRLRGMEWIETEYFSLPAVEEPTVEQLAVEDPGPTII